MRKKKKRPGEKKKKRNNKKECVFASIKIEDKLMLVVLFLYTTIGEKDDNEKFSRHVELILIRLAVFLSLSLLSFYSLLSSPTHDFHQIEFEFINSLFFEY